MSDTPKQRIANTLELIEIMKQPDVVKVDAATILCGGLERRGSHVISMNDGIVYDTDIDDEEVEWTEAEFAEAYPNSSWIIDDIERDENLPLYKADEGAAS
jgi:hypothetical protein